MRSASFTMQLPHAVVLCRSATSFTPVGRAPAPRLAGVARASAQEGVINRHPDAIRRRREAEKRERERTLQMEETQRSLKGEAGAMPSNMLQVHLPAELDLRVQSFSRSGQLVVVHYKGAWCASCARMQYKLKKLAKQNADVVFIIVDLTDDDLRQHCEALGVDKIPYFHMYKDNVQVASFTCNLEKIDRLRCELQVHGGNSSPRWGESLANVVPAPSRAGS